MGYERNYTVCFSGHRSYAAALEDEARLAAAVEAAFSDGYRTFFSGMAPGFDLAAAEAVVRLRDAGARAVRGAWAGTGRTDLRLVAVIPFARQAAGYSADDRIRYEALLAAADEVRVLEADYTHGCYYRRDEWMVERSGRIICWYDSGRGGLNRAPKASSGTRYTVRKAVAAELEVVNIFRAAGTLF